MQSNILVVPVRNIYISSNLCGFLSLLLIGFYLGKNLKARGGNLISLEGKAVNIIELVIKYSPGFILLTLCQSSPNLI
jgi:hypothetical protein